MAKTEMKPTKEEITPEKFFIKKNTPELDENGSYDFVPFPEQTMDLEELYELMQEYAEQFHKEKMREELINYDEWFWNEDVWYNSHEELIDEYLKTLNTK